MTLSTNGGSGWVATAGDKTLTASADPSGNIAEALETNNGPQQELHRHRATPARRRPGNHESDGWEQAIDETAEVPLDRERCGGRVLATRHHRHVNGPSRLQPETPRIPNVHFGAQTSEKLGSQRSTSVPRSADNGSLQAYTSTTRPQTRNADDAA